MEVEARADEVSLAAYGVLAAIAQAFGAKKAMKQFVKSLKGATSSDSGAMSKLRDRMRRAGYVKVVQK